jgi:protein tyrosine phosphatase (PTP) superfamily phosphohydrolase (DUF442 family)
MRTAWAYAAHCIREHATPLNDAMDLVGALQDDPSGHPICPLLGIETTFEFADPPHGSGEPRPATDSEPRPAHPDLAPAPAGQSLPPAGLHAPTPAPPEVLAESSDDFTRVLARVGPLYISGQPSQAALRRLRDEGVSVVINLRTPREMDNREWVPFDEAAVLAELGIDYVRLPLGRPDEHPWTPGVVDAFARALAEHEGKALLHCTVAWRASLVWAAYLVRHHAMDLNQALEQAGTIYPLAWPLEGLLERRILLRITREPRPEAGTPPGEVAPAHHAPQPS